VKGDMTGLWQNPTHHLETVTVALWRETARGREIVRPGLTLTREQWHRIRNQLGRRAPAGTRYMVTQEEAA
jgi:hypothetical protein